jgi:hypothetical protein
LRHSKPRAQRLTRFDTDVANAKTQKKARREEFSGQGGFQFVEASNAASQGLPDQTPGGAKSKKCCVLL